MKKQLTALAFCLTLTLTACGPKQTAGETPPVVPTAPAMTTAVPVPSPSVTPTEPTPTQETKFAPVWTEQKVTVRPAAEDGTELLNFEMTVPEIKNAAGVPAYEGINSFYTQEAQDFQQAAEEELAWAQDDYTAAQSSGFPFHPYVQQYTYLITQQNERYVSISRELYANSGGDDPTVYRFGEQFDLESGEKLALADFFTDPEAATQLIQKTIIAQNAGEPDLGIEEAALTASFQPERFYLNDEGFVFYYQGEDLGSFYNPVEYTVAYTALEGLTASWIEN